MQQRPTGDTPPQFDPYTPPTAPRRTPWIGRHPILTTAFGCTAIIAAIAAGTSKSPTPPSGDTGTAAAPAVITTSAEDTIPDTPATTAPPVQESVTFACTGTAPDGVDITYGPSGSSFGATSLPLNKKIPLDRGAQYYNTEAQLSGSGSVTCTTTVVYNDGGTATTVVNTGSASGGYNIASAQVCATFTGGWEKC